MSTLGSATIGSVYSIAPAAARSRDVAADPTAPDSAQSSDAAALGAGLGGTGGDVVGQSVPAWMVMGQTVAAYDTGLAPTLDQQIEQDAVVEGAISMPARPLAEIISQIRAVVDAHRTEPSRGTKQSTSSGRTPTGRRTPPTALVKAAVRAYTNAQQLADHQEPVHQVDIYHVPGSDHPAKKTGTR